MARSRIGSIPKRQMRALKSLLAATKAVEAGKCSAARTNLNTAYFTLQGGVGNFSSKQAKQSIASRFRLVSAAYRRTCGVP